MKFKILEELAYDVIWSWDHKADAIWNALDADLWMLTRNPVVILQTVSKEKIEKVLSDSEHSKTLNDLKKKDQILHKNKQCWFQKAYTNSGLHTVAYFSMEFMLSEMLPIYSGGLGNVAGDQLKSVNDLGVPVVGIGLLYQQGYFRQIIEKNGSQSEYYPYNSTTQLPIKPVRLPNGEWLRLEIHLPGWTLWLLVWEVKVGRTRLYLLDSNDAANYPPHRAITSELYGGNSELRLKQEMVLGIGGWRLLEALGIHPEVCHLNEGHAAFAILERARSYKKKTGVSFEVALSATRAGNLFTTHTAVAAGFDRFDPALLEKYLGYYVLEGLEISFEDFLSLGRTHPNEPFNMAYLAIRGSGAVNGVSHLHQEVSKQLFSPLFPRWPLQEIPIGHVTNGIHVRSWDSSVADTLWTQTCGKDLWLRDVDILTQQMKTVPDEKIWKMRNDARKEMIEFGRTKLSKQLGMRGGSPEDVERAKHQFNTDVFTMGFARRFADYKRPNLLLQDPERLCRILTNKERPAQLIIAGKAHPADFGGKDLIRQWMQFILRPEIRPHIVFIADYDMSVTERLVGGIDLWINTPRRPWEACGTSGMKILVNGGLNLSELDGWWAESYQREVGWALGDGKEHGNDPTLDAKDANQLYDLLENEIIPEFYQRNKQGIPTAWVNRVRQSMAELTPRFSTNRAVKEYTEKYYLLLAANYQKRIADNGKIAQEIVKWRNSIKEKFAKLSLKSVKAETRDKQHSFEVQLDLNGLEPQTIQVQLFALGAQPIVMKQEGNCYTCKIDANRSKEDFTVRVVPYFSDALVPLETNEILWQK